MRKNTSLCCVSLVTCLIASGCGNGRNPKWEYKTLSTSAIIASALQDARMGPDSNQVQSASSPSKQNPLYALASIGLQMRAEMDTKMLPELERQLNELGREGWELVAHNENVLIFRRRK